MDIEVQAVVIAIPQLILDIVVAGGGVPAAITYLRGNAAQYCSP